MNETSMTASVGCSPKIRGSSARALVFSITTTRGSLRSLTSSWPVPTSTAYTRAAPRCARAAGQAPRHYFRPPPPPRPQQNQQNDPREKPADVSEPRYPSCLDAAMRRRADGDQAVEKLDDDPEAEHDDCRNVHGSDEEAEDQKHVDPRIREQEQVGAEDAGHGAARADHRHRRAGVDERLGKSRRDA